MYNNLKRLLKENSEIEAIFMCDFKNESLVSEVTTEVTSIKKFMTYRTIDKSLDCANSNDSCNLANDIYKTIWNWNYEDRHTVHESLNNQIGVNWIRYGPDTMNSLKTIYNAALKINKNNELETNNMFLLQQLAILTHTMGNFTLIALKLETPDHKSFN